MIETTSTLDTASAAFLCGLFGELSKRARLVAEDYLDRRVYVGIDTRGNLYHYGQITLDATIDGIFHAVEAKLSLREKGLEVYIFKAYSTPTKKYLLNIADPKFTVDDFISTLFIEMGVCSR